MTDSELNLTDIVENMENTRHGNDMNDFHIIIIINFASVTMQVQFRRIASNYNRWYTIKTLFELLNNPVFTMLIFQSLYI